MNAIQIVAPGKIEYTTIPQIPLENGEVRISVAVTAICGSDLKNIKTPYNVPIIPGHEFSGTIIEVSEQAKEHFKIGDRVTAFPMISCMECKSCLDGNFRDCDNKIAIGFNKPGSFATEVNIDHRFVILLDQEISFEQGALLEHLCCGYRLVQEIINSDVSNKSNVLIIGDGPIALGDLQFLKNAKYENIYIIGKHENRLEFALELGAKKIFSLNNFLDSILNKSLNFEICIFAAPADEVLKQILPFLQENSIIFPQTRIKDSETLRLVEIGKYKLGRAFAYAFEDFGKVMEMVLKNSIQSISLITRKISLESFCELLPEIMKDKGKGKTLVYSHGLKQEF